DARGDGDVGEELKNIPAGERAELPPADQQERERNGGGSRRVAEQRGDQQQGDDDGKQSLAVPEVETTFGFRREGFDLGQAEVDQRREEREGDREKLGLLRDPRDRLHRGGMEREGARDQ